MSNAQSDNKNDALTSAELAKSDVIRQPRPRDHALASGLLALSCIATIILASFSITFLWFPHSILLGLVLVYGRTVIPTLIASITLFMLAWGFYLGMPWEHVDETLLMLPVPMAVQMLCGYYLICRWAGWPNLLIEEKPILKFILIVVLTSAITPLATTALRVQMGFYAPSEFATYFFNWWIRCGLTSVVVTPLVLASLASPRPIWRPRIIRMGLPILVGLFAIAVIDLNFLSSEQDRIDAQVKSSMDQSAQRLEVQMAADLEIIRALKAVFDTDSELSREAFSRLAKDAIARRPTIESISWKRHVRHSELDEFIRKVRASGFPEFQVTEINPQQTQLVKANVRDNYTVLTYVEPMSRWKDIVGMDTSAHSEALALEAEAAARDSGQITLTSPYRRKKYPHELVMTVSIPVYRDGATPQQLAERRGAIYGTVSMVYSVGNMIEQHILSALPKSFFICVYDQDATWAGPLIYGDKAECDAATEKAFMELPINVGDRRWRAYFYRINPVFAYYTESHIYLLSGAKLFLATFVFWLFSITGRQVRDEALVHRRTEQLRDEIDSRERAELKLVSSNRMLTAVYAGLSDYLHGITAQLALQNLLNDVVNLTNSEGGFIGEFHTDNQGQAVLRAKLSNNFAWADKRWLADDDGWLEYQRGDSILNKLFGEKQLWLVNDPQNDPTISPLLPGNHPLHCFVYIPFVHQDEVIGAMGIYNRPGGYDGDLVDYLQPFVATCNALMISLLNDRARDALTEELSYQASHDSLTGLANRAQFEARLEYLLDTQETDSGEHTLCFFDLDQFKVVNDTCGHAAGDVLLKQISRLVKYHIRKSDMLARFGGDEFALIIEFCPFETAMEIAGRIRCAIEEHRFSWDNKSFSVSVSIGMVPVSGKDASKLLQQADAACYEAKHQGRNRVHVFSETDASVEGQSGGMHLVAQINEALELDRFELFAQPIIATAGDRSCIQHLELLVRMRSSGGKLVPPGAFLAAAERYNLAVKIDRWVVGHALFWMSRFEDRMSRLPQCCINLSGQSLSNEAVLSYLVERINYYQIPAEKLCFEITETAAITNLLDATHFIDEMKQLGCQFALDDFGSGLSSYGYLKNLQIDYLKIDGGFVKDICTDPVDYAVVKSINDIGHAMGLKTIAEFVESDEVLSWLQRLGVDYSQGYGIGQPVALAEFDRHYPGTLP